MLSFLLSLLDLRIGIVLACVAIAWFWPRFGERVFGPLERGIGRFAARKSLAIVVVAAFVILLRVSLLKLIPVPVPAVHDEFSYLLQADTFAHGRLTNPPHPMWIFFETFHVNQHPTYMSKYPPGQGAVLALGQYLGNPWIGVLLSVAAMYAAILWALQGWMPPGWALLGTAFAFLQFGVWNYWTNSYWGGAVAAIGGALVIGALPRIFRRRRPRDAVLLGIGVAILANSRPYEGLIFCVPVFAALAWWLWRKRTPSWRGTIPRVVAPAVLVLVLAGVFMGYYNWRGTGNPLLLPYVVNDRALLTTPHFVWQKLRPPREYLNPQFADFYNDWAVDLWKEREFNGSWGAASTIFWSTVTIFPGLFVRDELLLVIVVMLPWLLRDRKARIFLATCVICFAGFCTTTWFQTHYVAPLMATVFALIAEAVRHLRCLKIRGRPVGFFLSRALVVGVIGMASVNAVQMIRSAAEQAPFVRAGSREPIAAQLEAMPGEELAIVRYGKGHDPGREWVYNRADIDHAKVVWAREIPGVDIHPLLDYFRGRHAWLVEPEAIPPRISPYPVSANPADYSRGSTR
ncbi:MAG: hypothetical protein WAM08_09395 [Candidatus Acidiferrales bacterium]